MKFGILYSQTSYYKGKYLLLKKFGHYIPLICHKLPRNTTKMRSLVTYNFKMANTRLLECHPRARLRLFCFQRLAGFEENPIVFKSFLLFSGKELFTFYNSVASIYFVETAKLLSIFLNIAKPPANQLGLKTATLAKIISSGNTELTTFSKQTPFFFIF